ncbi:MAG: hypothetical protein P1U58_04130 [Verrucomicrobiales bacterium]|nr:hypothetical protein [Verrucomicrobiales bacterium]
MNIRKVIPAIALLLTASSAFSQMDAPILAAATEDSVAPEAITSEPQAAEKTLDFVARSEFIIDHIVSNSRQVDPFGMAMDPTNTVETSRLADQYDELEDAPVITNSALKNALQTLPITGIYPERHTIVLGARTFKRGGIFGMKLEEITIRLRFEGIKGDSVYFKDLDTQEVATVEFNTRPAEFEPITQGAAPPRGEGIVPMDDLYIAN